MDIYEKGQQFLENLQSGESHPLFKRNKVITNIETGNLFFNNVNTNESIYDFFLDQQDLIKKLLQMEFSMSVDYDEYILEFRCDMLKHKNSKLLLYNLNGFLSRINEPVQLVRHTTVVDGNYALEFLQEKDWPYFIQRILLISEKKK